VHISTGQTPFYALFRREATLPVNWINPLPKAGWKMDAKVMQGS